MKFHSASFVGSTAVRPGPEADGRRRVDGRFDPIEAPSVGWAAGRTRARRRSIRSGLRSAPPPTVRARAEVEVEVHRHQRSVGTPSFGWVRLWFGIGILVCTMQSAPTHPGGPNRGCGCGFGFGFGFPALLLLAEFARVSRGARRRGAGEGGRGGPHLVRAGAQRAPAAQHAAAAACAGDARSPRSATGARGQPLSLRCAARRGAREGVGG